MLRSTHLGDGGPLPPPRRVVRRLITLEKFRVVLPLLLRSVASDSSRCPCPGWTPPSVTTARVVEGPPTARSRGDNGAIIELRRPSSSFESNALTWLALVHDGRETASKRSISPAIEAATTMTSSTTTTWKNRILRSKPRAVDRVKRVIDGSTIQLEKGGYVSLESVRGVGSTYVLPDCFSYSPSHELRRLLPAGTVVRMIQLEDDVMLKINDRSPLPSPSPSPSAPSRAWIVRDDDGMIVNEELVRAGFAYVRRGSKTPPDVANHLMELERIASERGLGIFVNCADGGGGRTNDFVAQFEPLDYSTEIRYGDDGGTTVVVSSRSTATTPLPHPSDPGDSRGCSDFGTYEDALLWYETYAPYYGDVAKLDRDGDGVPCPGLPHTADGARYRMKRPNTR